METYTHLDHSENDINPEDVRTGTFRKGGGVIYLCVYSVYKPFMERQQIRKLSCPSKYSDANLQNFCNR